MIAWLLIWTCALCFADNRDQEIYCHGCGARRA